MAVNAFMNNMFGDLGIRDKSNKYFTMNHVNESKTKVVVKVADEQVFKTKYGYALILNARYVQFLKDWQVRKNWYGTFVMIQKDYFNPKQFGEYPDYSYEDESNLDFITWLEAAEEQENLVDEDGDKLNPVYWG